MNYIGTTSWKTLWYSHEFLSTECLGNKVILDMNEGGNLRHKSANLLDMEEKKKVEINLKGMSSQGECFQWDMEKNDLNFQMLVKESGSPIYVAERDYSYQEPQVYVNDRIISVEP